MKISNATGVKLLLCRRRLVPIAIGTMVAIVFLACAGAISFGVITWKNRSTGAVRSVGVAGSVGGVGDVKGPGGTAQVIQTLRTTAAATPRTGK